MTEKRSLEGRGLSRRRWLAHCSLLAASGLAGAATTPAPGRRILVVGDSLSAEYGLARGTGWVTLLAQRLQKEKLDAAVINASISGDTTSGGRARLPALLTKHKPTHVVIELGGNDALRGLPIAMTRDNLAAMVDAARQADARVLVVGMRMPPNYGRKYSDDFAAVYADVAKQHQAALVPFLLSGVADVPQAETLFQPDRIHPLAEAHPRMMENVWAGLRPLLRG